MPYQKFIAIIAVLLLLGSCSRSRDNFLQRSPNKVIAVQPFGDFDKANAEFIRSEVSQFFGRKVILLPGKNIPPDFQIHHSLFEFSADSFVVHLRESINDSVIEIIGLVHRDIYTLSPPPTNAPAGLLPYFKRILGLGTQPGHACVISDSRIQSTDLLLWRHRLRTVVLHEMGHNLGLSHCTNRNCIMSDANGNTQVLDQTANDYCSACRERLNN